MTLHFTKENLDFVPFGCYTNYTGAIKKIIKYKFRGNNTCFICFEDVKQKYDAKQRFPYCWKNISELQVLIKNAVFRKHQADTFSSQDKLI